jgi:serine phosphatase RsbU (regulator of sigma subunit)/anti-sigma regulatory factor (Ser/Thr protein kinase)
MTVPKRARLSIRWILPLATVVLTTLVGAGVGIVGERSVRQTLTNELVRRLCAQSTNVALMSASAMLTPYPELTLHPVLVTLREHEPELALATVCDRSGTILGDADPLGLGRPFRPPPGVVRPANTSMPGATISESATLIVASTPVIHPNGTLLGTAYLGMRRSYIDESVRRARQSVVILFVALLALGVAGSFVLTSRLLRPLGVLQAGFERIGHGDLDTRMPVDSRTEFGQLAETVNHMTAELKAGQRREIERERMAHELQLAQRIQRALLPPESAIGGPCEVAGVQRPAAEVGGDIYDVFRLPDGRLGVAIADVAGKGLAGCLVTSMVSALLVALRESCKSPAELLGALDHTLSQRLDRGVFVTMFVVFIDVDSGRLVYASAGHHPALLAHPDGRHEWLESRGLPIGADRRRGIRASLKDAEAVLRPGDLLLHTTDGIHEAEGGPAGEAFGFERIVSTISGVVASGPGRVISTLSQAVAAWRGEAEVSDDETIVAVRWQGAGETRHPDPHAAPLELLAEARSRGASLMLPPTLEALVRIEDWFDRTASLKSALGADRPRVILVLNELCANVVEHGFSNAAGQPLWVWWVPPPLASPPGIAPDAKGHFVIVDQGTPFSADTQTKLNYDEPRIRRRGRGFGIDIVRRAASRLVYHPSTPVGNVTLVAIETTAVAGEPSPPTAGIPEAVPVAPVSSTQKDLTPTRGGSA